LPCGSSCFVLACAAATVFTRDCSGFCRLGIGLNVAGIGRPRQPTLVRPLVACPFALCAWRKSSGDVPS
jgi:hypothetical protein